MNRSYTSIKRFNKALQRFLYTGRVIRLLPYCGWTSGGCRSLMKAMITWLSKDNVLTYQIVKNHEDNHSEHAFVKAGNFFIDGDGISTNDELIHRWLYEEGLSSVVIREFNYITEPIHKNGEKPYYISEESINTLAKLLDERFNKQNVFSLCLK